VLPAIGRGFVSKENRLFRWGGRVMKANGSEGLKELLCQALQTEMGGIQVYRTALRCAVNPDLKKEWQEYLEQTENHERIVRGVFGALGLDPGTETPGRAIVREKGEGLVAAMEKALASGRKEAAQLVACECVVEAETKDHLNWELIGECAKKQTGEAGRALKAAHEEVEDEEDEHLYHTQGWCRELWLQSLGQPAVLPPPEERKDVKTAIGAARAKASRRPKSQGVKTASATKSAGNGGKRRPGRSTSSSRSART
jgi:rubrerythrin